MNAKTHKLLMDVYQFLDWSGTVFPENSDEKEAVIQRDLFVRLKEALREPETDFDSAEEEIQSFIDATDNAMLIKGLSEALRIVGRYKRAEQEWMKENPPFGGPYPKLEVPDFYPDICYCPKPAVDISRLSIVPSCTNCGKEIRISKTFETTEFTHESTEFKPSEFQQKVADQLNNIFPLKITIGRGDRIVVDGEILKGFTLWDGCDRGGRISIENMMVDLVKEIRIQFGHKYKNTGGNG